MDAVPWRGLVPGAGASTGMDAGKGDLWGTSGVDLGHCWGISVERPECVLFLTCKRPVVVLHMS